MQKYYVPISITSPRTPGRHKILNSTNPRLPTGSDDPAPGCGFSRSRLCTFCAAWLMVLAKSSGSMKWEQEQVPRSSRRSLTSFMPRRLLSRLPLTAFPGSGWTCRRPAVQNDHVAISPPASSPRAQTNSRRGIPPRRDMRWFRIFSCLSTPFSDAFQGRRAAPAARH